VHRLSSVLLDVHGSVHHSTTDKEKSNKMQQCIKILLFHIYMKLNMFRATRCPSSGAENCTGSLWFFIILWKVVGCVVGGRCQAHCARQRTLTTRPNNLLRYYEKPEAASAISSSWWWAVCRPKYVEFHINMEWQKFWYIVASCWIFLYELCWNKSSSLVNGTYKTT
jgi:hypothetical protein